MISNHSHAMLAARLNTIITKSPMTTTSYTILFPAAPFFWNLPGSSLLSLFYTELKNYIELSFYSTLVPLPSWEQLRQNCSHLVLQFCTYSASSGTYRLATCLIQSNTALNIRVTAQCMNFFSHLHPYLQKSELKSTQVVLEVKFPYTLPSRIGKFV